MLDVIAGFDQDFAFDRKASDAAYRDVAANGKSRSVCAAQLVVSLGSKAEFTPWRQHRFSTRSSHDRNESIQNGIAETYLDRNVAMSIESNLRITAGFDQGKPFEIVKVNRIVVLEISNLKSKIAARPRGS